MAASARSLTRVSNPSTWNSTIRAAVNEGLNHQAILTYRQMKQTDVQPNHLTLPFVLKASAKLGTCEEIHAHVLKSNLSADMFVATAMVDAYVKCREIGAARLVFDRMPDRDVASWNVMMAGLSELGGSLEGVLGLYQRMRMAEVSPDLITIICLSQSCSRERELGAAEAVHCLGVRRGFNAHVAVSNTWIAMYAKCQCLVMAELVFSEISAGFRSVVSWNSMIAGYAFVGRSAEVAQLFARMNREGVRPDLSTILSLLSSFAHSEALSEGKIIHSLALKAGYDSDISATNTLISLYSKCGEVEAARYCFDSMPVRSCVSWTAMIGGYAKVGDVDMASKLFHAMEASGERPDAVTMVAILSACSGTCSLELGRTMNRYAVANGFEENVVVRNALIDMYAKCGSIAVAREVFDRMNSKTVVSWTAMIAGYAMNGLFKDALDLFVRMLVSELKPNHVTFLAVLQACTHGGFLEKGWDYFDLMRKVYQIKPRLEHYACMVHLMGRCGKIKEALEFIQSMPVEADAGVWGALLGACLTHHETQVGEYAASRLFELQPQAAVSYVAMANIYAAKEKWEGVAKIRIMMRQKGINKTPGQSAVEVNGKFHAFSVEDKICLESLELCRVFYGLASHLKDVGDHQG